MPRLLRYLLSRPVGSPGPAEAPAPPRLGPLSAAVTVVRLPADLLVTVGYLVRELPFLVQDVRSVVNDVARLAHAGDPGVLATLLEHLARAAGPDGELTLALRRAGELAGVHAAIEAGAADPEA